MKSRPASLLLLVATLLACGSSTELTAPSTATDATQSSAVLSTMSSTPGATAATVAELSQCDWLTSVDAVSVLAGTWIYGDVELTLEVGAEPNVLNSVTPQIGDILFWLTFIEESGGSPGTAYLLVSEDPTGRDLTSIDGVAAVELVDFEPVVAAGAELAVADIPRSVEPEVEAGIRDLAEAGAALASIPADGPRLDAALGAGRVQELFPVRELVADALAACDG